MGSIFDVKRFEQALQLWEQNAFVEMLSYGVANGVTKFNKSVMLGWAQDFREHLLNAAHEEFDPKFELGMSDDTKKTLIYTSLMGEQLHSWCRFSRNVFQIDDNLRVLLQATSFNTETWNSIPWPFDSFAVTLEKPVEIEIGIFVDTIIFAKRKDHQGNNVCTFCFLPVSLESFDFLDETSKAEMIRLAERKRFSLLARKITKLIKVEGREGVHPYQFIVHERDALGCKLNANPTERAKQLGHKWIDEGIGITKGSLVEYARLVASLALYLTTLPASPAPLGVPKTAKTIPPAIKRNDPRLISSPSTVFRLTHAHTLSPDDKAEMEEVMAKERTGLIIPHWRRGYYRRPIGMGSNPDAPRTVHILPVFVNRRHLPMATLPGGAFVTVRAPK